MQCEDVKTLLSGYIDGELDEKDRDAVERHLAACDQCRTEYEKLRNLVEVTSEMRFKEPAREVWDDYWSRVYNRLERGAGWMIFVLGIIVWVAWGVYCFVKDPTIEAVEKVIVAAPIIGILILLISVIRERVYKSRFDKYSREVKR
jgi:hypothetical protein